ncbi:hypothetical protein OF83DRAFT_1164597 [Amylostereum chailletii]|nr:hypothetical protein OF83DRAFT_1164597 [Amylostereum chailletii]
MPYDFISSEPSSAESPWDENPGNIQDAEWQKLSDDFTNAGYREGITAGKEGALQEGFDAGFALAEAHAREHLEMTGEDIDDNEDIAERRRVEQLEDMMNQLSAGAGGPSGVKRPTIEDVRTLKTRLDALCAAVGIVIDPQRS